MSNIDSPNKHKGPRFIKLAGSTLAFAVATALLPLSPLGTLLPTMGQAIAAGCTPSGPPLINLKFVGTDGWISLPRTPSIGFFHPDSNAPTLNDGSTNTFTTYIFGFRDVTGLSDSQISQQKMKAQHNAPLFWVDEFDANDIDPITCKPKVFRVHLTNLGMQQRPDLFDSHTLHWHGFRNVIPYYDGEPTGSIAVPPGSTQKAFDYIYSSHEPGTYMYHCHVEDVEHVHMGMTGLVFVRPLQNKTGVGSGAATAPVARVKGGTATNAPMGYAYNDGVALADPKSTAYDREYAMFLSEVWAEAHWDDAHIQLPDWTDYHADFGLLNGRTYPDTLQPNSPWTLPADISTLHSLPVQRDATTGELAVPTDARLQYQPLSARVEAKEGERVLLRFANLGFREASMNLDGAKLRVIGKDATPMKGRDGTDTSYETNTLEFGAGESFDAIFTAPAFKTTRPAPDPGYDTYVLYNRNFEHASNLATGGFGGQRTEIRVYPSTDAILLPQQVPNQLFHAL